MLMEQSLHQLKPLSIVIGSVLPPPLSNSWIMNILWLHIALNRTLNIDGYWVGAILKQ